MRKILKETWHNPLLWLLTFLPVVFLMEYLKLAAHTAVPGFH